jgi:methylenetetrahydrofolate dehydrogenase (NADP+)/methenyltetrahydrofolate cyclohydrolase
MQLLDGKKTAEAYKEKIADEVALFLAAGYRKPHLAAILVGTDGASETYVGSKVKSCAKIGFDSTLIRFDPDVTEQQLIDQIQLINANPGIDGLIVQLPLPDHISADRITLEIDAEKDVDGFHPQSIGRLASGIPGFVPATPKGVMMLLAHYNIKVSGKHAVIIGRSNIVGMPMSLLLSKNTEPGNCTVTLCHSKTQDLKSFTLQADLIVAALGKPEFLTADMVKEGAIVIDVGITRIPDDTADKKYRIAGDVDFKSVSGKASWITPVPGGVGAMTIAALMQNTMEAYKRHLSL